VVGVFALFFFAFFRYWKQYQYRRAGIKDILKWNIQFNTLNVGIVTGHISRLAVIDVDDLSLLPELKEGISLLL